MFQQRLYNLLRTVIPAKAGIQIEKPGFRIKSGMTNCVKTSLKYNTSMMIRESTVAR